MKTYPVVSLPTVSTFLSSLQKSVFVLFQAFPTAVHIYLCQRLKVVCIVVLLTNIPLVRFTCAESFIVGVLLDVFAGDCDNIQN